MKLSELKREVYESWLFQHEINEAIVELDRFKSEMRQYGDLRRKSTWIKAFCCLEALSIDRAGLDAYELITIYLNILPEDRRYPYRHQIFEEFLAIPDALELLKIGFEQLFSSDFTTEERREAHGFFAMVEEQYPGRGVEREPAQLVGRIAELAIAAAG